MAAILIVDNEVRFSEAAAIFLRAQGHQVTTAPSLAEGSAQLKATRFDVLFIELMLPDGSGLALLDTPVERRPGKTIVITGNRKLKTSIRHMQGPALGYLTKPVDLEALARHCAVSASTRRDSCGITRHFGLLVGEHEKMHEVYEQIRQVAQTYSSVLILGESGTGKELIAQAIHRESARSGPLIPVNCGALSTELIASELFGHEKGSFTGAASRHIGAFEQAAEGTLFLDEVTEMPIDQQPHLLRVIESRELQRVGGCTTLPLTARIVSATNRALEDAVAGGRLREDLYYRLAMFPIQLPPLRERRGDIPRLTAHFVESMNQRYGRNAAVRPKDMEQISAWHWPGNVRQLHHAIHRAFVATPAEAAVLKLPEAFFVRQARARGETASTAMTLRQRERDHILATLRDQQGSRKRSAELLGISPKTLYNRIADYQQSGDPDFLAL